MRTLMKVLKNLFGLNKKISASEIAIEDNNGKAKTLDVFLNNGYGNIYSTNEIVIGRWIDGKPLYQKVMSFDDTISQAYENNSFSHNISNVDVIFVKHSFAYAKSKRRTYTIPVTLYNSNTTTDDLSIMVDKTSVNFFVKSGWNTLWQKIVVLNYTKTTD